MDATPLKKEKKPSPAFIVACCFSLVLLLKYLHTAFARVLNAGADTAFALGTAIGFAALGVLAAAGTFAVYLLICKFKASPEKLFLIVFPSLCIIYLVMFLPGSPPDEPAHFFSAYKISNYMTFSGDLLGVEGTLVRGDNTDFYELIAPHNINADTYASFAKIFTVFRPNDTVSQVRYSILSSGTLGHIAPAIGITVGRILNFSLPMLFYMGRLANIAFFTAVAYRAIKISPIGKNFILLYCVLPMNMHLTASNSYDVFVNAVSLLIIAEFLKLYYSQEKIGIKSFILPWILAFLLAPTKLVYLPVPAIFMLLKKQSFKQGLQKWSFWLKASVFAAGLLAVLLIQLPTNLLRGDIVSSGNFIEWANEEGYTIARLLADPIETIKIFAITFKVRGGYYMDTAIGSTLGWLNVEIPQGAYFPFYVLLLACAMKEKSNTAPTFKVAERLWAFALFAATVGMTLLILLLAHTPISNRFVLGVQGRYFIPVIPLLLLIFRNKYIQINEQISKLLTLAVIFYPLFYISEVFAAVFI